MIVTVFAILFLVFLCYFEIKKVMQPDFYPYLKRTVDRAKLYTQTKAEEYKQSVIIAMEIMVFSFVYLIVTTVVFVKYPGLGRVSAGILLAISLITAAARKTKLSERLVTVADSILSIVCIVAMAWAIVTG
jgi:hypothetical protein